LQILLHLEDLVTVEEGIQIGRFVCRISSQQQKKKKGEVDECASLGELRAKGVL